MPDDGVPDHKRLWMFAGLVAVCLVVGVLAIVSAAEDGSAPDDATAGAREALPSARKSNRPVLVYRSLASGSKGQPAMTPLHTARQSDADLAPLNCDRVTFNGGRGICLARGGGFAEGYQARIFGPDLEVSGAVDVTGIASRARVSPDGKWGSVTLFVAGHSYADAGAFSTETTLIDMRRGEKIADLEDFTVTRDGAVVTAVDVNFWGVSFDPTNAERFYATLATGGETFLVVGSLSKRTLRTIHRNVECPAVSPDGTRVAYKKRVGGGANPWQLTVLDLASMRETPLPGTNGLDDQAEWLDDANVLYGTGREVRVVPADASGRPRTFRSSADSPAVVRWTAPRKINAIPAVDGA